MKEVVIKFTNIEARRIAWYLRRRYGKNKRVGLKTLCTIAVRREVAAEAEWELEKAEVALSTEGMYK